MSASVQVMTLTVDADLGGSGAVGSFVLAPGAMGAAMTQASRPSRFEGSDIHG